MIISKIMVYSLSQLREIDYKIQCCTDDSFNQLIVETLKSAQYTILYCNILLNDPPVPLTCNQTEIIIIIIIQANETKNIFLLNISVLAETTR